MRRARTFFFDARRNRPVGDVGRLLDPNSIHFDFSSAPRLQRAGKRSRPLCTCVVRRERRQASRQSHKRVNSVSFFSFWPPPSRSSLSTFDLVLDPPPKKKQKQKQKQKARPLRSRSLKKIYPWTGLESLACEIRLYLYRGVAAISSGLAGPPRTRGRRCLVKAACFSTGAKGAPV